MVEVRVALSGPAAKYLNEPHVRRLIEIELQDSAVVAPGASGPLGDHVAYVWIDQPSAATVGIEVRVGNQPVARREVGVSGLIGDVAARIVSIRAAEMVRAQMEPVKPPKKETPAQRPAQDAERPFELQATPTGEAMIRAAVLPADRGAIVGPSIGVGFRGLGLSEELFGSLLTGSTSSGPARWLELGLGADYRVWLGSRLRLRFGGAAAVASIHASDATSIDGVAGAHDSWSARAGGELGLEARVASPLWVALALEPAAILRPIPLATTSGTKSIEGAWLGFGLSLQVERSAPSLHAVTPPPADASADHERADRPEPEDQKKHDDRAAHRDRAP